MTNYQFNLSTIYSSKELYGAFEALHQSNTLLDHYVRTTVEDGATRIIIEEKDKSSLCKRVKNVFDKSYNLQLSISRIIKALKARAILMNEEHTIGFLEQLKAISLHVNSKKHFCKITFNLIGATIQIIAENLLKLATNRLLLSQQKLQFLHQVLLPIFFDIHHRSLHSAAFAMIHALKEMPQECAIVLKLHPFNKLEQALTCTPEELVANMLQENHSIDTAEIEGKMIPFLGKNSPVIQRFNQVMGAMSGQEFEKEALPIEAIFRFAAFCWTAEKTKRTGQHYHKKGCCGLHHPVLIDWSQRFIYPIARREKSALYESGSGKVVINALGVPFDSFDPKRIVQAVRAVPKIAKLPSNAKDQKSVQGSNQDLIQSFKKEIRMYSALKKAPYIMPLLASYEKPEAFISKKGPPILLITKKAEFGNLYDALKYHTINRQQCIHALVLCLKEFHELGLIHSDIKCQNILIDKEGNLFLSDFETSFSTNQLPIEPHFTFTENYYPAKWYCAPELLLRDKKLPPFHETATGREYQLVESFAVGCVAYLLHFDKEADWVKRIKRIVAKLGFSYLFTQRQEKWIHDKMKACIEEPLLQLPQQAEKRSRKEHLCWAIFNLMRMDPKVRWDLATAHNYLQQYVAL